MGVRIGELSLPAGFDGMLPWAMLFNRAFLRWLEGYGLCVWRLGKFAEALRVFERLLRLNPNDNRARGSAGATCGRVGSGRRRSASTDSFIRLAGRRQLAGKT